MHNTRLNHSTTAGKTPLEVPFERFIAKLQDEMRSASSENVQRKNLPSINPKGYAKVPISNGTRSVSIFQRSSTLNLPNINSVGHSIPKLRLRDLTKVSLKDDHFRNRDFLKWGNLRSTSGSSTVIANEGMKSRSKRRGTRFSSNEYVGRMEADLYKLNDSILKEIKSELAKSAFKDKKERPKTTISRNKLQHVRNKKLVISKSSLELAHQLGEIDKKLGLFEQGIGRESHSKDSFPVPAFFDSIPKVSNSSGDNKPGETALKPQNPPVYQESHHDEPQEPESIQIKRIPLPEALMESEENEKKLSALERWDLGNRLNKSLSTELKADAKVQIAIPKSQSQQIRHIDSSICPIGMSFTDQILLKKLRGKVTKIQTSEG